MLNAQREMDTDMLPILSSIITPLLSLFVFVLGNSLFTTLLVMRMHVEGSTSTYIGAMTSAYYLGLVIGSFGIEKLIIRVGHIRVFSACASGLAVICLLHGIFYNLPFWLLLRLMGGFATAALFVVIESWLLVTGTVKTRGRILSLYMISFYAAQAIGQLFVNLSSSKNLLLFAVAAMLSSLSVIPLAMTKSLQPQISEPSVLSFRKLYRVAASGMIGCFCSGLILSAIYGLLPLFIIQRTNSTYNVAAYMASVIFGGMALQYPLGKISDHIERRTVLIGITIGIIVMSILALLTFKDSLASYVIMFLFGGVTFTLYPVCISQGCDNLATRDIVSGTQGMLLAFSIGATAGPLIAPLFIRVMGPTGLFFYFMVCSAILMVFFTWRRLFIPSSSQEEPFMLMPQTTPITAELDPRGEEA